MRYDILYTIHMPGVGEVKLYFDDIRISGFHIFIPGVDCRGNTVNLVFDKLVYPRNRPDDCGYAHVISYTIHGKTTTCDMYKPIH